MVSDALKSYIRNIQGLITICLSTTNSKSSKNLKGKLYQFFKKNLCNHQLIYSFQINLVSSLNLNFQLYSHEFKLKKAKTALIS